MTIATDLPTLDSLRDEQRALRAQLGRLGRRLRLQLALEFAADAAVVLASTAAALVFLDWWFRFDLPVRIALLSLSLAGVAAFLAARAYRRWRASRLDELSLAMTLDRHRPGTGQRIADVLQLPDLLGESAATSSASPAMVRLAVRQATTALAGSDWRSLWNRKRTALHAATFLAALIVPTAFAWWAPQAARLSLARWLLGSSERWPQRTYLTVVGLDDRGRLLAPRDERSQMEVRSDLPTLVRRGRGWAVPGRGEPLTLREKPEKPAAPRAVQIDERTAEGAARDGAMVETGPGRFRHEFPPSSASSTFELVGGDDWLGPITLARVDRPSLSGVSLRVREPGATYPGFRTIDDPFKHLLFLPDTEVELKLVGSETLSDLGLKVHPGSPPKLSRLDDRTFAARWTLVEATTLEILLNSAATGLASRPSFLSLGLLKDREPRVTLRAIGVGNHVTPVATIPVTFAATDDLGLASLRLQVDRTLIDEEKSEPRTKRQTVPIPLATEGGRPVLDHQARHDVPLQADPPEVGTLIRIVGEAEDKGARGAQVGRSGAIQFQVVSPEELFYEILIRQRAERAKFVAVVDAADRQGPALEGEPSAEDVSRVLRVQHANSRQVDQIAGRIADTLQEMKLNQVGSPKSHRLLQDAIIDPLRALAAGPLNELRNALQALANPGAKSAESREAARRLNKEVVTTLRNILDQMSQWESFVDVVNQVAEVIRMEQKVLQDTEKARETRTREIFDASP